MEFPGPAFLPETYAPRDAGAGHRLAGHLASAVRGFLTVFIVACLAAALCITAFLAVVLLAPTAGQTYPNTQHVSTAPAPRAR